MRTAEVIRAARADETDAVAELCGRLDRHDYVPRGWREWVQAYPELSLVAEAYGRIVGCVRAGVECRGCAFAQGLRVDPEFRRTGVASALMQELFSRLSAAGVCRVLGVTMPDNAPARRLYPRLGFLEIGAIARRRHPAWKARGLQAPPLEQDAAEALAGQDGLLVNRPGLTHCRRIWFRAPGEWLRARAQAGLLIALQDGAWALLDPPGEGGPWIAAWRAAPSRLADVADAGVRALGSGPMPVTIEAPDHPSTQACLTELGFEAPGAFDRYILLEASLG